MRIVFVTRAYWPAVGGQENYLRHLADGLAAHHDVVVLAQTNSSTTGVEGRLAGMWRQYPSFTPYADGSVQVRQVRVPDRRRLWLWPSLLTDMRPFSRYAFRKPARRALASLYGMAARRSLRAELAQADIVHMWGADVLGAATLRAAETLGKPSVITPFAHAGQHGDDAFSGMWYRRADRVVGLLSCDAELYERLGVDPKQLHVLPVCSPGVSAGTPTDVRATHGISGALVLFLAVRRPYKGLDILLGAMPTLAHNVPGATLAVAGPGAAIQGDHALRVLDLGELSDAQAADWLRAADLLCLPSKHEIFPVSFLEAWSVGTAVVGSDIATLAELLSTSGGGVAVRRDPVELGSELASLLLDAVRCRDLGTAGREWWLANATPDRVVAAQNAIYESLLNRYRDAHDGATDLVPSPRDADTDG